MVIVYKKNHHIIYCCPYFSFSATSSDANIISKYPAIARAEESVSVSDADVVLAAMVADKLYDVVVDQYNGDNFANYKRGGVASCG